VGGGPIADAAGVATTLAGSGIPLVGGSVLVEVLSPALRLGVPDGPGLP
jgi:hypothetical protein